MQGVERRPGSRAVLRARRDETMDARPETPLRDGRAALALEGYMAEVREAVCKTEDALNRESEQVAKWTSNTGR